MEEQRKAACAENLKRLDEKLGIVDKQPSQRKSERKGSEKRGRKDGEREKGAERARAGGERRRGKREGNRKGKELGESRKNREKWRGKEAEKREGLERQQEKERTAKTKEQEKECEVGEERERDKVDEKIEHKEPTSEPMVEKPESEDSCNKRYDSLVCPYVSFAKGFLLTYIVNVECLCILKYVIQIKVIDVFGYRLNLLLWILFFFI